MPAIRRSILLAFLALLPTTALADSYDDQIASLRTEVAHQQAQAKQLSEQTDTLNNKLGTLQAQSAALQAQIQLNQARFDQGQQQIAQNEARMASAKTALGSNIKQMYLDSTVTPLEMLASSTDLSQYFNQETYQDTIKQKVQSSMAEIARLTDALGKQQAEVKTLLSQQQGMKDTLAQQTAEAAQLLADTQGQEASYEAQSRASNARISQLQAQQASAIAAASRRVNFKAVAAGSGNGGACDIGQGTGGYPASWCGAAQDSLIDSWGMYNRECVSYAAWAESTRFGKYVPYWGGRGNAKQWPDNARGAGISVDGTPRVGDVAIYMGGYYGHAMIVEQVKGPSVIVSSMNGDLQGHFRYDEWPVSSLQFIHF